MSKRSRPSKEPPPRRSRVRRFVAVFIALALINAIGWRFLVRRGAMQPPDILLISIDTLRADRLGCYGYAAARTPTLDALAREGVVFEHAYAAAPITLPSHATLFTGLIPPRHGVRDNGSYRLPDSAVTLAERLKERGYQTGAVIGGEPLARAGGLAQGFDFYEDAISEHSLSSAAQATRAERNAREVLDHALRWMNAARSDAPVFAFIHLYDPHSPYEQALPGAASPSYDGEIAYVDRTLGAFFASLDAADRRRSRVVLLTSDHGEALGEHGERTHCTLAYESTLRVPLILRSPDLAARRVSEAVGVVDVAPTLLEAAGAAAFDKPDGVSLIPTASGGAARAGTQYFESLFAELRFGWAPLRGVRDWPYKYVDAPRPELYDLSSDAGELNNLADARPAVAARLAALVRRIGPGSHARASLSRDRGASLAKLGYLTGTSASAPSSAPRADPKDRIAAYEQFQKAQQEYLAGRPDAALTIMRDAEPHMRGSSYYYLSWGNIAAEARQWPLAAECYEKCLALDRANRDGLRNLGTSYLELKQPTRSIKAFEALVELYPDDAEGHLFAGVVRAKHLGDAAGAIRHWKRFLELAPNDARAAEIRKVVERAERK